MLNRLLALKLLEGDEPELHLRFLREARAQARLDHPNICRIYDVGIAGSRPYIAMELLAGDSLAIVGPTLTISEVASLLADATSAIEVAHQAGLIHRDLKPSNILIGEAEEKKAFVVDFGLAQDFLVRAQTLSWAVMGTPAFMSPEQARGESLGPATDIYSLGATLYAILSGRPPYEATSLGEMVLRHESGPPRPLRRHRKDLPKDLESIVMKCLDPEPGRRYARAKDLESDLREFLAGRPVRAQHMGTGGRVLGWARRRPRLALAGGFGLSSMLLLGGWNVRAAQTARQREAAAQQFGMVIRDAEHLLRIERMMPAHDIRPAETRLRLVMNRIQTEMDSKGGIAQGPGWYALGRGHLALRDSRKAREMFLRAWEVGFHTPDVASGLALSLLRILEEERWDAFRGRLPKGESDQKETFILKEIHFWLAHAKGTSIEPSEFVEALLASAEKRFEDADRSFSKCLEKSPWLFEAWESRGRNQRVHGSTRNWNDSKSLLHDMELASGFVTEAINIAPSDEDCLRTMIDLQDGVFALLCAEGGKEASPLVRAQQFLKQARLIRPDSAELLRMEANTTLQWAFLQLSTGGDPAEMLRTNAKLLQSFPEPNGSPRPEVWYEIVSHLHHAWWVIAEADWRFGRDPLPAISEAGKWATAYEHEDGHHLFPLLIEAKYRRDHGGNVVGVFRRIDASVEQIRKSLAPGTLDTAFYRSIFGEICLERAKWEMQIGADPRKAIEEGIVELERGAEKEPSFIYTYYFLPSLYATRAKMALSQGADSRRALARAKDSAKRGIEINPSNPYVRLAAAEASLAAAMVATNQNQDSLPLLEDAGKHLEIGRQRNPRDFRLESLLAEVEFERAKVLKNRGINPTPILASMNEHCRKGLQLKADSPNLHLLLAKAAEFNSIGATGATLEAARERVDREGERALRICPGHRETKELLARIRGRD